MSEESNVVLDAVARNVPEHRDEEMLQGMVHATRDGVTDEVSVVLKKPPVRTPPFDRQVGRNLGETFGSISTEQQAGNVIYPSRREVSQESESRRDDCSVLCAVRSLQAKRVLKESGGRWPNVSGQPELVGHE